MERAKYRIDYTTKFSDAQMVWTIFSSSEIEALKRFRRHCTRYSIRCEDMYISLA